MKWVTGSGVHGYWLGIYENEKQQKFIQHVKKGGVVYDIGANVGFYTLLSSVLVGETGQVVAFEPLPANIVYLERHLAMNRIRNVQVVQAAVSDENGTAMFSDRTERSSGHLDHAGKLEVRTITLDTLYERGEIPPPDIMKIDVEGG